ncbi:uncharacterized protein EV420DRAFT_1490219 [Desarmillaria tabescens]|uniref:Uncharacterized protein n=1 Tax=Armillaria tabescens TaxID=1929756 RepID=A0AA39MFZ2_ARMTA|nr:uncharacterized protein EV420DRAFT_1490219 [Desarmillaria tabescens]KAK0432095.1 hypothetical protein EV420DRAFT_1490219 [Desarmillaria tabescens]
MAPALTPTTKLSHEDGLLLLIAHAHGYAHKASLHDALKTLADVPAKVQNAKAYVTVLNNIVTVESDRKKFTSKPLNPGVFRQYPAYCGIAGTLFSRPKISVLKGENDIWIQQYPSYEANTDAKGRVVIGFWTNKKIVAVMSILPLALVPFSYSDILCSSRLMLITSMAGPGNLETYRDAVGLDIIHRECCWGSEIPERRDRGAEVKITQKRVVRWDHADARTWIFR